MAYDEPPLAPTWKAESTEAEHIELLVENNDLAVSSGERGVGRHDAPEASNVNGRTHRDMEDTGDGGCAISVYPANGNGTELRRVRAPYIETQGLLVVRGVARRSDRAAASMSGVKHD